MLAHLRDDVFTDDRLRGLDVSVERGQERVAIEAGRLLRADTIDSFTRASQTLLIEVTDGPGVTDDPGVTGGGGVPGGGAENTVALRAELARRGLPAQPFQRALLVPLEGDRTYDVVRDAVAALGLPLSRLERRRHQVEEIFRDDQADRADGDRETEATDVR